MTCRSSKNRDRRSFEKAPSHCSCLALAASVARAEAVVDPDPDRVNIEVAPETVRCMGAGGIAARRLLPFENTADAAEIDIEVLGLERPAPGDDPFESAACGPSDRRIASLAPGIVPVTDDLQVRLDICEREPPVP